MPVPVEDGISHGNTAVWSKTSTPPKLTPMFGRKTVYQ
jgi:hypothetical protein